MLSLVATVSARHALRALRATNPELFEAVGKRLNAVRHDPGGPEKGRDFRLDDGSSARLIVFYDAVAGRNLVHVLTLDEAAEEGCRRGRRAGTRRLRTADDEVEVRG